MPGPASNYIRIGASPSDSSPIAISGSCEIEIAQKLPAHDILGKGQDAQQPMGRHARVVKIDHGNNQLYTGNPLLDASQALQLRSYSDNDSTVYVTTLTQTNLPCRVMSLTIVERFGQGVHITMHLQEVV